VVTSENWAGKYDLDVIERYLQLCTRLLCANADDEMEVVSHGYTGPALVMHPHTSTSTVSMLSSRKSIYHLGG